IMQCELIIERYQWHKYCQASSSSGSLSRLDMGLVKPVSWDHTLNPSFLGLRSVWRHQRDCSIPCRAVTSSGCLDHSVGLPRSQRVWQQDVICSLRASSKLSVRVQNG